jgi:hypothetical protein
MIIDIELTRQANNRYAARAIQFPDLVIEAISRDEALSQMREALLVRRRAGSEIVQIAIDDPSTIEQRTWPRHAGAFADDEAYQIMLAEIEQQRRVLDQDAG